MPVLTPKLRRWLAWSFFCALPLAGGAATDDVEAAWQLVADHLGRDAYLRLSEAPGPATRERTFAQAVLSIDFQPVTQDRLRQAEAVLAELAKGDDEIAAASAYLQARVHQVHLRDPDYAKAAELYRVLAERRPRSHWAQLGVVKRALLILYALPEPSAPADRIAAAAALRPLVQEKELVRDLELQLGRAGAFYEQPLDTVLPHLVAADQIGGLVGLAREDLIVMIGELSLRAGHYAQSRTYFERYLHEYSYNLRLVTVRRRLEDLAALEAKAKEAKP